VGALGRDAHAALPALRRILEGPIAASYNVRRETEQAIAKITR